MAAQGGQEAADGGVKLPHQPGVGVLLLGVVVEAAHAHLVHPGRAAGGDELGHDVQLLGQGAGAGRRLAGFVPGAGAAPRRAAPGLAGELRQQVGEGVLDRNRSAPDWATWAARPRRSGPAAIEVTPDVPTAAASPGRVIVRPAMAVPELCSPVRSRGGCCRC